MRKIEGIRSRSRSKIPRTYDVKVSITVVFQVGVEGSRQLAKKIYSHTFILARARTIREERRRGVQDVEGAVASCWGRGFVSGRMSEEGTESGIEESVGRISEDGQGPEYRARS